MKAVLGSTLLGAPSIQRYRRTDAQTHRRADIDACIHSFIRTYIQVYLCTYMHAYTHTHMHAHRYLYLPIVLSIVSRSTYLVVLSTPFSTYLLLGVQVNQKKGSQAKKVLSVASNPKMRRTLKALTTRALETQTQCHPTTLSPKALKPWTLQLLTVL